MWIYDDEGYKQQGVIVRSYTSLRKALATRSSTAQTRQGMAGSAHMVAYSPKINTPPPSPTYSEVEQRMELGEISENNNNKDDNNNNNNNKSADYNTAYDSLIADGHSEEDAKEMLEAAMEEEEKGVEILPVILEATQWQGKLVEGQARSMEDENSTFAKIFDEKFQAGLSKALINAGVNKMATTIAAGDNPIGVVHFTQCDTNGKKHSTLCVEATTKEWANFAENITFTYEGITFVGKTMAKWLQDVKAVKWTGKIIAVNMGPLPFHPTQKNLAKYEKLLAKTYGTPMRYITYANRTVTISFALGKMEMPKTRKPITLLSGLTCIGKIHPFYHIKVLGEECCNFCPAIGDNHIASVCIPNKNDAAGMEARKKKKSAQQAKRAQAESAGHAEYRTAAQREMARVNFK